MSESVQPDAASAKSETSREERADRSERAERLLARERALHEANRPRSREEAIRFIREGLARVESGCGYIRKGGMILQRARRLDAFHDEWGTDRYALLERLTVYLFDMVVHDERDTLEVVRRAVQALDKARGESRKFGAATTDPYQAARWLRGDLNRIKKGGFESAIRAQVPAPPLEKVATGPNTEPTRWNVAGWLAIQLREFDPTNTLEARHAAIYERMPLNGHGGSVDRSGGFRDQPFAEDAEKTVKAAFKAIGFPPTIADQLFKADTMKRSRETKRRQRAARRGR